MGKIRIVCTSDTHNYGRSVDVPYGDIFIHAGDSTVRGGPHELDEVGEWIRSLPHMYKILISGNHDWGFQKTPDSAVNRILGPNPKGDVIYLQDRAVDLQIDDRTIRVYGSPWQPEFGGWAFNLPRGLPLQQVWNLIPNKVDILVTHGPPHGYGDLCEHGERVGCEELTDTILQKKPRLNVCGHIHEDYGVFRLGDTIVANASACNRRYNPVNPPLVFDYDDDGTMQQAPEV